MFGNIVSQTSPSNQPRFAYSGMQLDPATGLYYDSARYYDAGTGTFISQDPTGFGGGTADLYDYVGNDPVNMTDPSGERGFAAEAVQNKPSIQLMFAPPTGGGGGDVAARPLRPGTAIGT